MKSAVSNRVITLESAPRTASSVHSIRCQLDQGSKYLVVDTFLPDVLEAIDRTLRLDSTERDHMFRLADVSAPAAPPTRRGLEPEVQVVVDGLEPYPASVLNARYDELAASFIDQLRPVLPASRKSVLPAG
jgi:hypothetical protein